ncbi:MAG: hypothetical protein ABFQ53_03050 [Patescibacteria group bacterium]
MTKKKPSQDAMEKIMQGDVKQTPKWHFVVKNIALWLVGFVCIVAGALTISLIIFTIANSAFESRHIVRRNFVEHMLVVLPLLWILLTIMFVALFDIFVRKTKKGYKYSLWSIVLANILLSIVLGAVFYFAGISHVVDDALGERFGRYHSIDKRQASLFDNPESGVIFGDVVKSDDENFTIVTPEGKEWNVLSEYISNERKERIQVGKRMIVIGKKIDKDVFVACDVRGRGVMGERKGLRGEGRLQRLNNIQGCEENCELELRQNLPKNIEEIVEKECEHLLEN